MKGVFFRKPLELRLQVEGESWRQGDSVTGELVIRNLGSESVPTAGICVKLARGELKKVRAKSAEAFEPLASASLGGSDRIEPGQEASLKWGFRTDRNCPITDSWASLFLLYGQGDDLAQVGQLQLRFEPDEVIQEFLKTLEVNFRFVAKSRRSTKGSLDFKFEPPSARAFATLEHLGLSFRFEGETLNVCYSFQVKKVEATAAALDLKKKKLDFAQSFTPAQYRTPGGRVAHDAMEAALKEVLGRVESDSSILR